MNTRFFIAALAVLFFQLTACVKEETLVTPPATVSDPEIPSGERISIHFGTSTQRGCLYSFSNCIWIGWGATAANFDNRFALQFQAGEEAGQYFGQFFPLTADYTVNQEEAQALGIEAQVIPAGMYPLRDVFDGQSTGKKMVVLDGNAGLKTGNLVNTANPQENLGQLHNLAVQVVLHENREQLAALKGDQAAIQQLITEKVVAFLENAGVPVNAADLQRVQNLQLTADYSDYSKRLAETRLSDGDKKVLQNLFDAAAAIPVRNADELKKFLEFMNAREAELAGNTSLQQPKVVLSMISVLKYSRYFWFWRANSIEGTAGDPVLAGNIPPWVWADVVGMEIGGPVVSAVASIAVYLHTQ
jgi:hypothetical protein